MAVTDKKVAALEQRIKELERQVKGLTKGHQRLEKGHEEVHRRTEPRHLLRTLGRELNAWEPHVRREHRAASRSSAKASGAKRPARARKPKS